MKNEIKQIIIFIPICLTIIVSLSGCSNKNNDSELLKEKIDSEISYLDTQLLTMLNKTNGISSKNYIVISDKVETDKESDSSSKSAGNSSSESNAQSSSEKSNSSEDESSKSYTSYKMQQNNILSKERKTDWEILKTDIEKLYSSWSSIVLDLYKININSDDILSFGNDLDLATQAIKKEDKIATLNSLSKLYSYIPKYSSFYSNDNTKNNILKTKSHVLNAYSIIEQNNINEIKKELASAEQVYVQIVNTLATTKNNEYNVNKGYILIKELQNSIDVKDLDIFYIKYKNLIEELNVLQK